MSCSVRRRCFLVVVVVEEAEAAAEVEGSAEGLREVELEGPSEKGVVREELLPLLMELIVLIALAEMVRHKCEAIVDVDERWQRCSR